MVRIPTENATTKNSMNIELSLIRAMQSMVIGSPVLVSIAVFAARWLIYAFAGVAIGFWVGRAATSRHAVVEAFWAGALALSSTTVISSLVERMRPYLVERSGVLLLIPAPLNMSFPSGHTATAFALAAAFAFAISGRRWPLFTLATAVALGRMFVGVHYPTDIIGGAILGIGCAALIRVLHRRIRRPDINQSVRSHHHV